MAELANHYTIVGCIAADGDCVPLMILSPMKTIIESGAELVRQTKMVWAGTSSGWMTSREFFLWGSSVFILHVNEKRELRLDARALLIVGHSSR